MRKKDRRAFIRLSAYHLVKYKPLYGSNGQIMPVLAAIGDIGAGGVCLRVQETLPLASLIELKIQFPSLNTPIFTLVKVVWIKQLKRRGCYEIGAQFVEIEDSVRKIIDERVRIAHNRFKKSLGLFKFLSGKGGGR